MIQNEQTNAQQNDRDLKQLDVLANLLDNQFRIPGTQFRFGLDGVIGLIPYVGDIAGLLVSGILFRMMLKRGAGPIIMLRMMGNVVLDAIIGIVPFIGDLFDFGFKANRRNVNLLRQYYSTHTTKPNATYSALFLALLFLAGICATIWAMWKGMAALIGYFN
jgi:Domain of unknown function (DUF4112)